MISGTVIFDMETYETEYRYSMAPEEFVRLIGYKRNRTNEVVITTSLDEIREVIISSRWIIGHNINQFDLPVLFGTHSPIPWELGKAGRVFDTWDHASLVHPCPPEYVDRTGTRRTTGSGVKRNNGVIMRWFGLDEQAHQLGVQGKTQDGKALAKKYGGWGNIPLDDPDFIDYLEGDVLATERVAKELMKRGPISG